MKIVLGFCLAVAVIIPLLMAGTIACFAGFAFCFLRDGWNDGCAAYVRFKMDVPKGAPQR
jgi:hypothetical protein